jgi:hypothetical protein
VLSPPQRPTKFVDPTLKPSGRTLTVGRADQLQGAIDASRGGDRIVCDPSTSWLGNWRLTGFKSPRVIISSSRDDKAVNFVAPNGQPVFRADGPTGGYHILNASITVDPSLFPASSGAAEMVALVQLGSGAEKLADIPRSFVLERTEIYGNPAQQVRRAIAGNCADLAVLNSKIREIHRTGFDSQGICCWNGPGPFLFQDLDVEAASENIMFGGAPCNGPDLIPSNITIRRVRLTKKLSWKADHPSFAGIRWNVKNHFELKNARRVDIDGMYCENNWNDGQVGRSIVLTPRDTAINPWNVVQDVDIRNVRIKNSSYTFVILGHDDDGAGTRTPETATQRIRFSNWLCTEIQNGVFHFSGDPNDIELDQLTVLGCHQYGLFDGIVRRLKLSRSILSFGDLGLPVNGGAPLASVLPEVAWGPVLFVGGNPSRNIAQPSGNPWWPGLTYNESGGGLEERALAAIGMIDPAHGNYRLNPNSRYTGLGADQTALESALRSERAM